MAMEIDTATVAVAARPSQVRVQLKSRSSDIQLPQETGPILVSTGENTCNRRHSKTRHSGANDIC
jgi:hypothetical protein